MQEALEGKASLPDVYPEIFVHFVEYCYTGNYQAPAKSDYKDKAAEINYCSCKFVLGDYTDFYVDADGLRHYACEGRVTGFTRPVDFQHQPNGTE